MKYTWIDRKFCLEELYYVFRNNYDDLDEVDVVLSKEVKEKKIFTENFC